MEKKVSKEKEELFKLIDSYVGDDSNLFFADYRGMTVEQLSELRRKLRQNNASLHIIKNRVTKLVLKDRGYSQEVDQFLKGPTALVISKGDETISIAKDIAEFSKPDSVPLVIKGASVDSQIYDEKTFIEFSKLPTKSELYAKLMGTIQAPIANTASIMNNVIAKVARTLQAAVDENKFN